MKPVKRHLLSLHDTPDPGSGQKEPWRESSLLPQFSLPPRSPQWVIVTAGWKHKKEQPLHLNGRAPISTTPPISPLEDFAFLTVSQQRAEASWCSQIGIKLVDLLPQLISHGLDRSVIAITITFMTSRREDIWLWISLPFLQKRQSK